MKFELITFGEAMIRLSSPAHMRLEQTKTLDISSGGAEFNVAVNAARLGHKTAWISRLVDTWAGQFITNEARSHGVNTDNVVWEDFDGVGHLRNGFYHLEIGAGPRASAVTYDRAHTAISQMTADMVDWKSVFANAGWIHISGITPALSETLAETVVAIFKTANDCGIKTSYDLNYRGNLWSSEKAQKVNARILPYVKVLIGNEEDFEKCMGIKAEDSNQSYSKLEPESYRSVAEEAKQRFPDIEIVGTTLRDAKTGLLNDWRTLVFDGREIYLSKIYKDLELVDRVGGGDSFSAGLICSLIEGKSPAEACEFSGAYSALAHTFPGDINWATRLETEKAMAGGGARISR